MADDKHDIGPFDDNGEPDSQLAERLRRLNWPRPPDGVRERTWEQLRDLIPPSDETPDADRDGDPADLDPEDLTTP